MRLATNYSVKNHSSGFTLVELSIVLVIIGLLVGGILTGQTLIRKTELKTIGTEFSFYQKAITNFRDQYLELPGDMSRATQYWGASANCPGDSTQGTTDGTTCDGDGNGKIERDDIAVSSNEWFRLWQHLSNADLIDGIYNGVTGPDHATSDADIGTNVPEAGLDNTGWVARWTGIVASPLPAGGWFEGNYGHTMLFGTENAGGATNSPALLPKELFSIDAKIDDGHPGTGKVIARWWDECTDAPDETAASAEAANYSLEVDDEVCAIIFANAF